MQPPLFYAPPDSVRDGMIQLPRSEAHHALSVLRLERGDEIIVIDGLGMAFRSRISAARDGAVTAEVVTVTRNFGEPAVILTLAAAMSTGSKFDTVVQKGTELGVKRFVPVLSEKSLVKLDDPKRAAARVKRLESVALAAAKQCRRAYCPDISAPVGFSDFLRETEPAAMNLIFHPGPDTVSLAGVLDRPSPTRVTLLVGPESGFSNDEVHEARSAGFLVVGLGRRILRAETAAPTVCALVMDRLGELS